VSASFLNNKSDCLSEMDFGMALHCVFEQMDHYGQDRRNARDIPDRFITIKHRGPRKRIHKSITVLITMAIFSALRSSGD